MKSADISGQGVRNLASAKGLLLATLLVTGFARVGVAQEMKKGIEFPLDLPALFATDKVYWYGLDLSLMKLNEIDKHNDVQAIVSYNLGHINDRFHAVVQPSTIQKDISKSVMPQTIVTHDLIAGINPHELISTEYELGIEEIQQHLHAFVLPQNEGVGFISCVELFNNPKGVSRFVTNYYVFFDIESREILYAVKTKGLPGSKGGYNRFWAVGLIETYKVFASYYKKQLRTYLK